MKISAIAVYVTVIWLVGCTSSPDQPQAGASLPACGSLPNCVNSESGSGGKAVAPLQATEQQWQQLKQWLAAQPDWTVTNDAGDFVQAVVKTPLMRYRDDVQLRYVKDAGVIHVRSSSRLGIGDMGANRKRVEMLRAELAGATPDG